MALILSIWLFGLSGALAQSQVRVIGGITPGNCVAFFSTTGIKDAGFVCNGGPIGAAGGVLSGTYPNPGFSTAVNTALTGTNNALLVGTGAFGFTATAAPTTAGQVAFWNGSSWVFITAPSTAGSLIYWNGTTYAILGGNNSGTQVLSENSSGVPAWTSAGATTITEAQGRLTLQANTPVMTTTQSAQSTLRYDCYIGGNVPYFNGSTDVIDPITSCEVTDAMVSAASAGQVVSGQVYDVWWVHGGANRICLAMSASSGGGGGWASDTGGSITSRGTGYTQLDRTTRPYITNKNSITNCFNAATNYGPVSANQGTYLGTVYASANGQISYTFGAVGTSGGAATAGLFGVWNMYQRVNVSTLLGDNASTWTYAVASTWRQAHASAGMQVQYVYGLNEDSVSALYAGIANDNASATSCNTSVGVDSTTTPSGGSAFTVQAAYVNVPSPYKGNPGLGLHSLYAIEFAGTTSAGCLFGGSVGVSAQSTFSADLRM
jgi:hypothetical protein